MTLFVDILTSMSGLLVMVFLSVIWLWRRPTSRAARCTLGTIVTFWVLVSFWPVAALFSLPLTGGYRPVTAADVATGKTVIVLLGGGHFVVRDWDRTPVAVIPAATVSRVAEAARVYRLAGDGWIISSGGGSPQAGWPNAEVMRDTLVFLGVPASRILLESASKTTRDEAVIVAGMLPALQADRVILVTSDIHMKRSMGAFRSANMTPIPAIARSLIWSNKWYRWILPEAASFYHWGAAVHEYLGIASYAARGWYR